MLDFIVNPMARRGSGVLEVQKATSYLDAEKIPYALHYTQYRKHATEIARTLTLSGATTIVSCGGDGTIHEIINGIIEARKTLEAEGKPFNTALGLLPCGTGNDFMRSADMSIDTLTALNTVLHGTAAPVDAINIDGVYEICFACRGIDVDVVNLVNASKRKTKSSYLKKILLCVFKRVNYDFCLNIDGKEINERGVAAAVLNGSKLASGMKICPPAQVDDGYLDVVFIKARTLIDDLKCLYKLTGDNFLSDDGVTHYRAKKVSIIANQKQIDIDGELFADKKFDAEVASNILNLIR